MKAPVHDASRHHRDVRAALREQPEGVPASLWLYGCWTQAVVVGVRRKYAAVRWQSTRGRAHTSLVAGDRLYLAVPEGKARCLRCRRWLRPRPGGSLPTHGPRGARCAGSGRAGAVLLTEKPERSLMTKQEGNTG